MDQIYVDILLVLSCFGAGWVAATLKVWGLGRRTTELEYRLQDIEGRVTREVKIRSGQAGQRQKASDAELSDWAKEQVQPPAPSVGPTLKPLQDWRRDRMTGGK